MSVTTLASAAARPSCAAARAPRARVARHVRDDAGSLVEGRARFPLIARRRRTASPCARRIAAAVRARGGRPPRRAPRARARGLQQDLRVRGSAHRSTASRWTRWARASGFSGTRTPSCASRAARPRRVPPPGLRERAAHADAHIVARRHGVHVRLKTGEIKRVLENPPDAPSVSRQAWTTGRVPGAGAPRRHLRGRQKRLARPQLPRGDLDFGRLHQSRPQQRLRGGAAHVVQGADGEGRAVEDGVDSQAAENMDPAIIAISIAGGGGAGAGGNARDVCLLRKKVRRARSVLARRVRARRAEEP